MTAEYPTAPDSPESAPNSDPRSRFQRIRTWVIVGLVLALTPIGLYDYWLLTRAEVARVAEAERQLDQSAKRIRDKLEELIFDAEDLLLALAQIPDLTGRNWDVCNSTMRDIGRKFPRYTNFSSVDESLHIVCSSGKLDKPVDVRRSPNIQEAFTTGKFAISPFKFGVLTGKPILVFSMPVLNRFGEVVAALNNGLDLSWLTDYIATQNIPENAAITVFSHDGRIIAHHPGTDFKPGDTVINHPMIAGALAGRHTFVTPDTGNSLLSTVVLHRVPGNLYIAAYMPLSPLQATLRQDLYGRLTILLAILIGTGAIILLVAQYLLVTPMRHLTDAADRLAAGDMSVRSGVGEAAIGEVGHLALCFDRMADSLEQREDSLKRSVADLEYSNTELERFAYVASHDLQEPLRSVISYTQFLERHLGDRLDDDGREYMGYVTDGARRMRRLVIDLLEYSRAGTRVTQMDRVDLNGAMRTVLRNLDDSIQSADGQITVDADLPAIHGDALQITLVLQNLVSNAIKYRRPDRPLQVTVSGIAAPDIGTALIRITDNGIGIEPHHRDAIFEAFKRLHGPDLFQGTGIGLAIVRRIVDRHGGDIWVEEATGGGSCFCLRLPLAEESDDPAEADE